MHNATNYEHPALPDFPPQTVSSSQALIHGSNGMAELCRSFDWSKTLLGPLEAWSEALRAVVNVMLLSPIPTALYLGADRLLLYNDGFRPFTASRHPASFGAPAAGVWKEAWHILGPQFDMVFQTGEIIYYQNFLVPIEVGGQLQDCYWDYSFVPIYDQGCIIGVFNVCQSTTARVVAERNLRDSDSRATRVLESIADAVIVTDAEGRVTRMNPVAEQLTGWTTPNANGQPLATVFRIVDESSRCVVESPADKVLRLGTVVGFANHTVLLRRDGEEIHIDDSGAPIRGDDGQLIGIVLVFRNVGDKRRLEREQVRLAAREHENAVNQELLLKLLQTQRNTTDPRAMMLAAAEMVGHRLAADRAGFFDIVDSTISRLTVCWTAGTLPLLTGDVPLTALGDAYLADGHAGKTQGVNDYATDPLTRDARFADIGVRSGIGVPILRHGRWQSGFYVHCSKVREWTEDEVAFAREVANQTLDSVQLALSQQALRRAEARSRKILESIADAVIVTDAEGRITSMNHVAEDLTGWPLAEAHGAALADVLQLVSAETGNSIEVTVEPAGKLSPWAQATCQALLVRRDGTERHLDQSGSPIREEDGSISGVVVTFRDVTARCATEQRLRQAYKMEALGQLTGGIAHDFNNILAIIMGNLELVGETIEGNDLARERIDQALASSEKAADLTRRLLAYARQQPLDPAVVNMELLVNAAGEFIRRSLGAAVGLQVIAPAGLWWTRIDRNQFENALLNLAVNARDAMPNGGQLTIECQNFVSRTGDQPSEIAPGEYLLLSVIDTGEGMTHEVRLRAIEPFFTTKPIGQGTGLGLSMVYGFLKQSGGHLEIESTPSVGTRVMLYLPRAVTVSTDSTAARHRPAVEQLPRGDEVILVVEDEFAIRRTIGYLLNSLGYRVLEAEDGPGAMHHLQAAQKIHLMLTDVILPNGISGPVLAANAKLLQPAMKVIFSSGYTSNVLTRDYNLDEEAHLLNKPFHLSELAKIVRRVLDLAATA